MGKTAAFVFGVMLLLAPPAFAGPSFEACRFVAPKSCALTAKSTTEAIVKCFDAYTLDPKKPTEEMCLEELTHAKVHSECKADIPQHCGKVKKGGNRTMSCLTENRDKLTKPCAAAIDRYNLQLGGQRKKRGPHGVAAVRC